MHTEVKIALLIRCCSLYGGQYYKREYPYLKDMEKFKGIVRRFTHKLFGTKAQDDKLGVMVKSNLKDVCRDNKGRAYKKYTGITVYIEFPGSESLEFTLNATPPPYQVEYDHLYRRIRNQ